MPLRHQFETEAEWLEHLRMYFAAKAMQGLMSVPDERVYRTPNQQTYEEWQAGIYAKDAATCYAMADAMLKAREQ